MRPENLSLSHKIPAALTGAATADQLQKDRIKFSQSEIETSRRAAGGDFAKYFGADIYLTDGGKPASKGQKQDTKKKVYTNKGIEIPDIIRKAMARDLREPAPPAGTKLLAIRVRLISDRSRLSGEPKEYLIHSVEDVTKVMNKILTQKPTSRVQVATGVTLVLAERQKGKPGGRNVYETDTVNITPDLSE